MTTTPTPGQWDYASDSYGKVKHSRKACVFTVVRGEHGERIVKVAAQVENWADARLIAAAPELLARLELALQYLEHPDVNAMPFAVPVALVAGFTREAIKKAKGVFP